MPALTLASRFLAAAQSRLLTLERHGLLAVQSDHYQLIKPDADKLAWFRDATRPSYAQAQERQQDAQIKEDPRVEVMQQMLGGGIPAALCVELAEFCEKHGIPMQDLRRYYQEVRVIHGHNQVDGKYTEIKHCGFLLKKRLERIARKA